MAADDGEEVGGDPDGLLAGVIWVPAVAEQPAGDELLIGLAALFDQ